MFKRIFSKIQKPRIQNENGSTLIVFLLLLTIMAIMAVGAVKLVNLNYQSTDAYFKGKNAFYSAEVGLDLAVNEIISEYENLSPYTESADYAGSDTDGYITVANYRDFEVNYKITNPAQVYLYQTISGNSLISHYAHTFNIQSLSTSLKDSSKEELNETIRILETPMVQYYIFYAGSGNAADLEILPGPTMNSWGRIHANGDIYIGANNAFNLRNYDDLGIVSPHSMHAGGNIYNKRKNNGSVYTNNNVVVKTTNTGTTFTPTEILGGDITTTNEATEETRFNEFVMVQEQQYSVPGKTQFVRGGFYESRAGDPQRPTIDGIKIIGTGGVGVGQIEVFVSRPNPNTDVTALILANESSAGTPSGLPNAGISEDTSGDFADCRQGHRDVDFTDIDLNLLQQWYIAYLDDLGLSLAGDGILVYASRSPNAAYTNDDTNFQAIRLRTLDATSVPQVHDETTIATDNPLYIWGDFNTISTRGVAIITDAINIWSNAFDGTKPNSCNDSDREQATETTLFAAFFSGNVPTPAGGGTYSGGLENYPRFHEIWGGGVACNFRGSIINLWTSTQARGVWGQSGVYSPPGRQWGWDTRFQDPDFWPPFIPSIFSVERVGFLE